jgi:site-specific recombinase XerD
MSGKGSGGRGMWDEIAAWEQELRQNPALTPRTRRYYAQDARRFVVWAQSVRLRSLTEVTLPIVWAYYHYLRQLPYAPATIQRAMKSLSYWLATFAPSPPDPFRILLVWLALNTVLAQALTPLEQLNLITIAEGRRISYRQLAGPLNACVPAGGPRFLLRLRTC